jgi:hypothetical protein
MARPPSPEGILLNTAVAYVRTFAAQIQADFEFATLPTVRHRRNRHALASERPNIALRLVDIERDPERQQIHSQEEVCWRATIDVIVDVALPSEESEDDPSGWEILTSLVRFITGKLCDPNGVMLTVADDVWHGDIDPDEDSRPDDGRLAGSIYVLYRTNWTDPNTLIAP